MAQKDLREIKRMLKYAGDYQEEARKTAERVGDKEGASRIREAEEKNKETIESFPEDL